MAVTATRNWATFSPQGGWVSNPPFDARMGNRGAVDSKGNFVMLRDGLKRGVMMTENRTSGSKRYMLNFQFNPTSFSHSATVSGTIPTQPTGAGDGQGDAWLTFANDVGQSVQFNLLFDRTFETWQPTPGNPASVQGVLVDVKTLYGMLGMYYGTAGSSGVSTNSDNPVSEELTPMSPMQAIPVWVVFGPLASYYGMVQNISVTFTHFTQQMVPVRAAVSVTMAVLPRLKGTSRNPVSSVSDSNRTAANQQRLTDHIYDQLERSAYGKIL